MSDDLALTAAEIKMLRAQNGKLTDTEFEVFIAAAKRYRLNPMANQIYAQLYNAKDPDKRRMVVLTGIDGYRLVSDRTGQLAGNDDPTYDSEEEPRRATVTVYKMVGGEPRPFSASARWQQYKPNPPKDRMWIKMPHLMLGKCAEALALRKAFPAELSGIYTDVEMAQASNSEPPEPQKPGSGVRETKAKSTGPLEKKRQEALAAVREWSGVQAEDAPTAARQVIDHLGLPVGKRLTSEEMDVLTSFVRGEQAKRTRFEQVIRGQGQDGDGNQEKEEKDG